MVIFILNFLAVLLLASRGLGQVQLSPPSLAVLHGAQARFNCSTAAPWVVMSWFLNDRAVITVSAKHGTLSNSVSFTVTNRTTVRSTAWELVIWNVTRNHTGDVTCDFQNIGRRTATLSVQVAGTVVIDGGNVTGRKGGHVRFRCQASDWYPAPTVTWALAVNQEVNNYTTSHAAAPDGLFRSTSTLDVLAMVDTWVQCQASVPALPAPKTHRVFLTVGPGGDDQTVLIAVVVSVLTIPLLVLLIIALICCCVNERRVTDGVVRWPRTGRGRDRTTWDIPGMRTQASPRVNSAATEARRSPSALTRHLTAVGRVCTPAISRQSGTPRPSDPAKRQVLTTNVHDSKLLSYWTPTLG